MEVKLDKRKCSEKTETLRNISRLLLGLFIIGYHQVVEVKK